MLTLIRPRRILEIGAAVGYSSSCFAQVRGAGTKITTLEADPVMFEKAFGQYSSFATANRSKFCSEMQEGL